MAFRIKRVVAWISEHELIEDRIISSSAGTHASSRYVTVCVIDEHGCRGFGEAATVPIWSGEAADTAKWLADNRLAPLVEGHCFDHPSEVLRHLDRGIYGNPFLKAAIDIAVWDLYAKIDGKSVCNLIGDREPVESIPTRASIGACSTDKTVRLAVAFWEAGVRTLKFKTGVPGLDDAERLRAVRERLGNEFDLTIDANGGYQTEDDAVAAINTLLPFGVAIVEQPTHRDKIGLLARVRRRVPVPILADECIFTPGHLTEALDCDAFDLLSVYPGKNGGFTNSLEMVKTAQQAGKDCVIGSNLETDLGQAAMIALAASRTAFPVERYACDLMAALFYKTSSTTPAIALDNGRVEPPRGLGFGVEPCNAYADHN